MIPDRPSIWLGGALAGGLLALGGLFLPGHEFIPDSVEAAAYVNAVPIPRSDLELALNAMARDSRNPLPGDAEARALERLIDEELLLQQGLALGLPREESAIRRAIVMSMIDTAVASAPDTASEQELRALFGAEPWLFGSEPRLHVIWETGVADERTRPAAHPPNRLLALTDLRLYLGDTLARAALPLNPGETAGPIRIGAHDHWVTLVDRADPQHPRFVDHRDQAERIWRERAQEAALETMLARLRREADIDRIEPRP